MTDLNDLDLYYKSDGCDRISRATRTSLMNYHGSLEGLLDKVKNGLKKFWAKVRAFFRKVYGWVFGGQKTTINKINTYKTYKVVHKRKVIKRNKGTDKETKRIEKEDEEVFEGVVEEDVTNNKNELMAIDMKVSVKIASGSATVYNVGEYYHILGSYIKRIEPNLNSSRKKLNSWTTTMLSKAEEHAKAYVYSGSVNFYHLFLSPIGGEVASHYNSTVYNTELKKMLDALGIKNVMMMKGAAVPSPQHSGTFNEITPVGTIEITKRHAVQIKDTRNECAKLLRLAGTYMEVVTKSMNGLKNSATKMFDLVEKSGDVSTHLVESVKSSDVIIGGNTRTVSLSYKAINRRAVMVGKVDLIYLKFLKATLKEIESYADSIYRELEG